MIHQFVFLEMELYGNSHRIEYALSDIERQLSEEPSGVGESREPNERVLISKPLTVLYEVFADAGVVVIYRMIHHEYGSF